MKVLFAVGSAVTSEKIASQYASTYGEKLEYKDVFYFKAILEEVKRNKSYDRIVIAEGLEPVQNNVIDEIDRMLFNNIDSITDEIEDSTIIFICQDNRTKEDPLIGRLFNLGIYNVLMGDERQYSNLCKLIKEPRNKKEAKEYLKSNPAVSDTVVKQEDGVNENELVNICNYFDNLRTSEEYIRAFGSVKDQYNDEDLIVIVAALTKQLRRGKDIFAALNNDPRYTKYCEWNQNLKASTDNASNEKKPKRGFFGFGKNKNAGEQKSESLKQAVKDRREQDVNPIKDYDGSIKESIGAAAGAIMGGIVANNQINDQPNLANQDQKAIEEKRLQEEKFKAQQEAYMKAQQEQLRQQQEAQMKAQQEKLLREQQEAQMKAQQEQLRQQQEAQMKAQQEQLLREQQEAQKKAQQDQILKQQQEAQLKAQREAQLKAQQEQLMRQQQEAQIKAQQEQLRQQQEAQMKAQQEQLRQQQEAQMRAQQEAQLKAQQDAFAKQQAELKAQQEELLRQRAALENQYSTDSYDSGNNFGMATGIGSTVGASMGGYSSYQDNTRSSLVGADDSSDDDYVSNVGPIMQVPADYKKVVAFVGTNKVGTTFMINCVATLMALKGVRTSILDMTKNRGEYWYFEDTLKSNMDLVSNCMSNLSSGVANPVTVGRGRNLSLFTTIPGGREDNRKGYRHRNVIDSAKRGCNLLIIDCDFSTPFEYFEQAQDIYIVQDLDLLKVNETKDFLKDLKTRHMDWSKLRLVFNNVFPCKLTPKRIVNDALSYYTDISETYVEEFEKIKRYVEIPMDPINYAVYIESTGKGKINYDKFTIPFKQSIETLSTMVYGVPSGGKRKGLFGNF